MASKEQPDSAPRELAAARAERERSATELYGVSRRAMPGRHHELEQAYNRANARVHELEGRPGAYRYQRDVREDFSFEVRTSVGDRGQRVRTVYVEGEISDPATVVNWRNTTVGKRHDERLRKQVASKTGDDAGHIVACEFGADPAERRNISRQSPSQNQAGGGWRAMEQRVKEHCSQSSDHRVQFKVQDRFHSDRYDNQRSIARWADLQFGQRQGSNFKTQWSETKPIHANMQDHAAIKLRTGRIPARPANSGSLHPFPISDETARRLERIRDATQVKSPSEAHDKPRTKRT